MGDPVKFGTRLRVMVGHRRLDWRLFSNGLRAGRILDIIGSRAPLLFEGRPPTTVSIELTNVCQLRCPYCTAQHAMRRPPGFMSPGTFANLLKQLKELHPRNIRLTGGGESTLHSLFPAWVRELRDVAPFRSVTTNGQRLTDETCTAVLSALDTIEISVDSDNATGYECSRVGGDFDTLIANLRRLRRLKYQMGSRTLIHIRLMIRPSERSHRDRLLRFWLQFGDVISTQKLIDYVGGSNDLFQLTKGNEVPQCVAPHKLMGVHWNGDVPLCDASADQMGEPEGLLLGNINSQPLASMWHGQVISTYRRGHKERLLELTPICRGCTDARSPRIWWKVYNTPAGRPQAQSTLFQILK
jgi:hypothetical protein